MNRMEPKHGKYPKWKHGYLAGRLHGFLVIVFLSKLKILPVELHDFSMLWVPVIPQFLLVVTISLVENYQPSLSAWCFGTFFFFSIIYGMSSFPLTFIIFKMVKATNQLRTDFFCGIATEPLCDDVCVSRMIPLNGLIQTAGPYQFWPLHWECCWLSINGNFQ